MLSHPLYTEFKGVTVNPDVTVVFNPGSGGSFLCYHLSGGGQRIPLLNEYASTGAIYLKLDNFERNNTPGDDRLYSQIKRDQDSWLTPMSGGLALCHSTPVMTSRICRFSSDEIILITNSDHERWLPVLLGELKWHLNNQNWMTMPNMFARVLENNPQTGHIDWHEYKNDMRVVSRKTFTDDSLINSIFSWKYFINCKANDLDAQDEHCLRQYAKETILSSFYQWFDNGYNPDASTRQVYLGSPEEDELLSETARVTFCDYVDLFFRLRVPATSCLGQISREAFRTYSLRNLHLLESFMHLLNEDKIDVMRGEIERLRRCLFA